MQIFITVDCVTASCRVLIVVVPVFTRVRFCFSVKGTLFVTSLMVWPVIVGSMNSREHTFQPGNVNSKGKILMTILSLQQEAEEIKFALNSRSRFHNRIQSFPELEPIIVASLFSKLIFLS